MVEKAINFCRVVVDGNKLLCYIVAKSSYTKTKSAEISLTFLPRFSVAMMIFLVVFPR